MTANWLKTLPLTIKLTAYSTLPSHRRLLLDVASDMPFNASLELLSAVARFNAHAPSTAGCSDPKPYSWKEYLQQRHAHLVNLLLPGVWRVALPFFSKAEGRMQPLDEPEFSANPAALLVKLTAAMSSLSLLPKPKAGDRNLSALRTVFEYVKEHHQHLPAQHLGACLTSLSLTRALDDTLLIQLRNALQHRLGQCTAEASQSFVCSQWAFPLFHYVRVCIADMSAACSTDAGIKITGLRMMLCRKRYSCWPRCSGPVLCSRAHPLCWQEEAERQAAAKGGAAAGSAWLQVSSGGRCCRRRPT